MSGSESEDEFNQVIENLEKIEIEKRKDRASSRENWWEGKMALDADQLRVLMNTAITAALQLQKQTFDKQIDDLNKRLNDVVIASPEVAAYKDIEIVPGKQCDESLDIVKSLPDFEGKQETYVSWRQAAHTAYKIFEKYEGSSRHYQAVAIIRNKVKGTADMTLASFNTALNFKAIIDRLDFTYSDKRPAYLIEQELSTLRQGSMTPSQFYDEVEKKLTLLTNKAVMTYEKDIAASMNEKYRADALRVFISGSRKNLSDVLFAARPSDLPSALALAQEIESNHERYLFATNYAKNIDDKERQKIRPQPGKNPNFFRGPLFSSERQNEQTAVQPMDVDPSSRSRQPYSSRFNNNNLIQRGQPVRGSQYFGRNSIPHYGGFERAFKRPNDESIRLTGVKQRINHMSQKNSLPDQVQDEYQERAEAEASEIDDDSDGINFLDKIPDSHS